MTTKTEIRKCTKCNLEKEATTEFFYSNKSTSVGLTSQCKECMKESSYDSYLRNKDLHHKKKRDKYNSDEEYRKNKALKQKEINEKNRSMRTIYHRNWREENRDKIKVYNQQREMSKSHSFTSSEWEKCKQFFNGGCAYCGISETEAKNQQGNYLHKEHVDHLGSNGIENCVPSCKSCNSKKWKFTLEEWHSEDNPVFSIERHNRILEWLSQFNG